MYKLILYALEQDCELNFSHNEKSIIIKVKHKDVELEYVHKIFTPPGQKHNSKFNNLRCQYDTNRIYNQVRELVWEIKRLRGDES